jgi:hypothetical protein
LLLERAVRPTQVVVSDVLAQHPLELPPVNGRGSKSKKALGDRDGDDRLRRNHASTAPPTSRSRPVHPSRYREVAKLRQELVNEAGDEVTVVQVHPDAASMEAHTTIVADRARAAYAETLDATVKI